MKRKLTAVLVMILTTLELAEVVQATDERWIDTRFKLIPLEKMRFSTRFVRLDDGRLMIVEENATLTSKDDGKTWSKPRTIYDGPEPGIPSEEGAFFQSAKGTLILIWACKRNFEWDKGKNEPTEESTGEIWSIRSLDGGNTWVDRHKIFQGLWAHPPTDIAQTPSGEIVIPVSIYVRNPGRIIIRAYVTDDEGKTWKPSNIIDLGGQGHHDGAIEPTLELLKDGRLWMLIRTNLDWFWEAYSEDNGLSWRTIKQSSIDASSSPGYLTRLASGRLALIWNRLYPVGKNSFPRRAGQFSTIAGSWHRQEISIAFSEDEGKTWSNPVVIARESYAWMTGSLDGGPVPHEEVLSWLSYPYIFEPQPGLLWLTTGSGALRVSARESDLIWWKK